MAIAHPAFREVELASGRKIAVRPWVMGQRAALRPKLAALLGAIAEHKDDLQAANLPQLFLALEDQVAEVVRASIPESELSREDWGEMDWGDLPILAQAVWDLNVTRDGSLLGKLGAGLGSMMATALRAGAASQAGKRRDGGGQTLSTSLSSTKTSRIESKREDSPSSPAAGAPIPNA